MFLSVQRTPCDYKKTNDGATGIYANVFLPARGLIMNAKKLSALMGSWPYEAQKL